MKRVLTAFVIALSMLFAAFGSPAVYAAEPAGLRESLAKWIVEETKGKVSLSTAKSYVKFAYASGQKRNVDPLLLLAIMKPESNYNAGARNKSGASGLLQIIPYWHQDKLKGRSPMDASTNVDVGAQIVDEYLDHCNGRYNCAIDRYSGGAKGAYSHKIKATYRTLREVILAWKMENNVHIDDAHKYGKPRHYGQTMAQLEQPQVIPAAPSEYERLITMHASVQVAYAAQFQ